MPINLAQIRQLNIFMLTAIRTALTYVVCENILAMALTSISLFFKPSASVINISDNTMSSQNSVKSSAADIITPAAAAFSSLHRVADRAHHAGKSRILSAAVAEGSLSAAEAEAVGDLMWLLDDEIEELQDMRMSILTVNDTLHEAILLYAYTSRYLLHK